MSDRDAFRAEQQTDRTAEEWRLWAEAFQEGWDARLEGCACCGTQDNLLWRKGDHELAVATICRACKFGACEACRGE